jgi:uncharacterized YigZ family protein
MIDSYLTIGDPIQHKITRKRSRFIALVTTAFSQDDAQRQLENIRKAYHDATHHCHAIRLLIDDGIVESSNDDGEPSGSAGAPILQQLAGRQLCNVLAVVVRYYGGTKLGVGGLVRAYSEAVSEAIDQATVITQALLTRVVIRFPVEVNSSVMSTIHRFPVTIEGLAYEGQARIEIAVPPSQLEALRAALTESTGARAELEVRP